VDGGDERARTGNQLRSERGFTHTCTGVPAPLGMFSSFPTPHTGSAREYTQYTNITILRLHDRLFPLNS
jgi:hypothetical protein